MESKLGQKRRSKRSITGEEKGNDPGEETGDDGKENESEANSDVASADLAENTPPVKKARGRAKKERQSIPGPDTPRPSKPGQETPLEEDVSDPAFKKSGDNVPVPDISESAFTESAPLPATAALGQKKEVKMKKEVKQQIREEPHSQDEEYYEVLTVNEYLGLDPASVKSSLTFWCKCPMPPKGQSGCLAECENRAKRVECDVPLCKAGEQCGNRAIQNNTAIKIAITEGFGVSIVVATEDIPRGVFLGQYTGQVLAKKELDERIVKEYTKQQKLYVLPLNQDLVIDASIKGSICRLACHSCSPNAEVVAWKVEGLDCLAMYSIKDIKANESITFEQSPQIQLLKTSKRCSCGARSCQKILGGLANASGPLLCGVCRTKVVEGGSTSQVCLHPALATPVCGECLEQYRQVDWTWKLMTTKTPGKEGACRWCTKTGKMVNCSDCPKSFCKKCLKINLGGNYIKLAETGSWTCLVCDTRPLDKIRAVLWAEGEEAKIETAGGDLNQSVGSIMSDSGHLLNPGTSSPGVPRTTRPPGQNSPGLRGSPQAGPRGSPQMIPRPMGGIRQTRPGAFRGGMRPRLPGPRGNSPRTPSGLSRPGGQRAGTPFPLRPAVSPRLLGQSNVTIEKVARQSPGPVVQQARSGQTEAIINQLQRYSGLSIQPISESVSHLDGIVKEVEAAHRILQEACSEARRISKEEGLVKSKERIGEGVKAARAKLAYVESRL
eukprot:GFUD01044851.1.p1 GENE.GFUD01044851.1~~GFUD01044851.1.p1  ORF type:complete len:723 (+),score=194.21 GFUD01044851.1:60-2228(+)